MASRAGTMDKLKKFGKLLAIDTPKNMMVYFRELRYGLSLVEMTYLRNSRNISSSLTRKDYQKIAYTVRKFQKVGALMFLFNIPMIGFLCTGIGLMYPKNSLTYHFMIQEEEEEYLKRDYRYMQSARLKLSLHMNELRSKLDHDTADVGIKNGLQVWSDDHLKLLTAAHGIHMFGSPSLISYFPAAFHRRWLEIKAIDTALDDELLREMLRNNKNMSKSEMVHSNSSSGSKSSGSDLKSAFSVTDIDNRELARALVARGLPFTGSYADGSAELTRWLENPISECAFPPPPLTPNRVEKISAILFPFGPKYEHNNSIPTPSWDKNKGISKQQEELTFTYSQTLKLFCKFMVSPVSKGSAIVEAYQHYLESRKVTASTSVRETLRVDHARYLIELAAYRIESNDQKIGE